MAAPYNDALFRTQFPEFASTTAYPAATISSFYTTAGVFISTSGSPYNYLQGDAMNLAMNQMTAHLMALSQQQQSAGVVPGSVQGGFETGSKIGEISVELLAPPVKGAWDWWLYQTAYGQALMALLSGLAVGGLSVGGISERNSFRKACGVFF